MKQSVYNDATVSLLPVNYRPLLYDKTVFVARRVIDSWELNTDDALLPAAEAE